MEPIKIAKNCQEMINLAYEEYLNKRDRSYVDFYEIRKKIKILLHVSLQIHAEENTELKNLINWVNKFDGDFIKNHSDDLNEKTRQLTLIK